MTVYHLQYRPQKLGELDLDNLGEKLKKLFSGKETPQSFLLSGPKGAGKTSVARIIARLVNCLAPENGEPCDQCENCLAILKGSNLDVIEIDAASNRGIDDIRNLKESSYLMPSKLKKKVFIIDEVHMLTKEAFNALLKVIEEPPSHVVFILCTTDEEKIPETILSRLVKIEFRKGTLKELARSLKRIVKGENLDVDDTSLELLASQSDGSFRNLQKSLNEIVMEYGKKISRENVEDYIASKFGNYSGEEIEADLNAGNVKVILDKLEKLAQKGINFTSLRDNWLAYFHQRLLKERSDTLSNWINLLIKTSQLEKGTIIEQLPLELAVIDYLKNKPVISTGTTEDKETNVANKTENPKSNLGLIEQEWKQILAEVKPFNHSVEAFLRAARPKKLEGSVLVLEVFYPFHKERLEEEKNRKVLEDCIAKVIGQQLRVEYVLGKNKGKPLEIKNDTPMEAVYQEHDVYDLAKDIFG